MGSQYNPSIVNDGLVMALDAANKKSYPGSGSAWNDLSQINWNGTLTNSGWSYSNDYITIPDNTSYVDFGTSSNLPTGDMSAFLWVYPLDFNSTWNILIRRWETGNTDFHLSIKNNSGYHLNMYTTGNSDLDGNTVIELNNWYNLGFTLVINGTLTFYVNGVMEPIRAFQGPLRQSLWIWGIKDLALVKTEDMQLLLFMTKHYLHLKSYKITMH